MFVYIVANVTRHRHTDPRENWILDMFKKVSENVSINIQRLLMIHDVCSLDRR